MFKFTNGDVFGEVVTLYVQGEGTCQELQNWIDETLEPEISVNLSRIDADTAFGCNFALTLSNGTFAEIGDFMGRFEEAVNQSVTQTA